MNRSSRLAKTSPALALALIACLSAAGTARAAETPDALATAHAPVDAELYATIAALDARLFDAYNDCDVETFGGFFTEDLEFYHDRSGLTRSRAATIEALEKNICGKTRRDLVPGTLEVYPLAGYGAVQMGLHRFCPAEREHCDEGSGTGRFVHLWKLEDGRWRITRVISYDHVDR